MSELRFPKHDGGGLTITHNDFLGNYLSAADWVADNDQHNYATWASDADRARALETGSIWTVQWYPDSPVGSYWIAASTLEAALEAANGVDQPALPHPHHDQG